MDRLLNHCREERGRPVRGSGAAEPTRGRGLRAPRLGLVVAVACSLFSGGPSFAAAAEPSTNSTSSSSSPTNQWLSSFQVKPGFRLELVAAEPMVTAPVALAFDENGRLFVAEMRDFSPTREGGGFAGRIRVLEDTNGSGTFQSSKVYAENVPLPSALACYAGGLFVAAAPDVLFLKDTKTNGVADVRRVVLTGLSSTNHLESERLLNNFNWGLDGRIHGATGGLDGSVRAAAANWPAAEPVSLVGRGFSFDPRTLTVVAEAGPAESGLCFDNTGRRFLTDFTRPLRLPLYALHEAARNPFYARPPQFVDVASLATPVFALAPVESAPAGSTNASNEAASAPRRATWLTDACGSVIYRGNAFPARYAGTAFIADPEVHLIHQALLSENGLALTASRASDEPGTEFLASRDPSFRPVQLLNGPDGALYIVDRQESNERGRIYRLVPEDFHPAKPPQLGKARTRDLVAALASPNGWYSDTAARLLFEQRDPAAVPPLSDTVAHASLPLARLRALHALANNGALQEVHLLGALRDSDEHVREHAVQLAEAFARAGMLSDSLWGSLSSMGADPSLHVRYQLALSLGEMRRPAKAVVLAEILRHDLANPWVQGAVLSALAEGAGDLFVLLANDARFRNDPLGQQFLYRLGTMIGTQGRQAEVGRVLDFVNRSSLDLSARFTLLTPVGEGLRRTGSSLALADTPGRFQPLYWTAFNLAINDFAAPVPRAEAIGFLAVSPLTFAQMGDWLLLLTGPAEPPLVRSAAIRTLGALSAPQIVPRLADAWRTFPPALRRQAVVALLARQERLPAFLTALADGKILPADLTSAEMNFLRTFRDPAISERAVNLLGPVPREQPLARQQFQEALQLRGAPAHGRQIFQDRCLQCHQLTGQAQTLGPGLAAAKVKGKEKILSAILEPNAEVPPDYAACVLETQDGENAVGILIQDNPETLTLKHADGSQVVWPHPALQEISPQSWSLMPDGLGLGLTVQDMADLLDFIMTAAL